MVFFRGSNIEHAVLTYFVVLGRVQTKLFHDSTTCFNCANPPHIPADPVQTLKLYDSPTPLPYVQFYWYRRLGWAIFVNIHVAELWIYSNLATPPLIKPLMPAYHWPIRPAMRPCVLPIQKGYLLPFTKVLSEPPPAYALTSFPDVLVHPMLSQPFGSDVWHRVAIFWWGC